MTETASPRYPDAEIARICHEAVRALQRAFGQDQASAWDGTDAEFRSAATEHVGRLRAAGCTAAQAHDAWWAIRAAKGWTLGPVKDEAARTSPSLVPFDQLPQSEQAKDYLFQFLLAAMTGREQPPETQNGESK